MIQTVLPGLYGIALPTPFAVGDVNVYVAEGDGLTLIDCGVRSEAGYAALVSGLTEIGYRINDIDRLIISHHHTDHLGLAQRIVEASGANVIAHPYTVPYLETPLAARERNRNYTDVAFRQGGVPQNIIDMLADVDDYLSTLVGTAYVMGTVDEGDTIRLANRNWRVLHTPGHAGGLICLFDSVSGVLLSSDHILRDTSSNPLIEAPATPGGQRPKRLLDYIFHLERVAALRPTIAYTGHGEPVEDVPALVAKRLEHHQWRAEKLFGLFNGEPHTLYEMTRILFGHIPESESYLTLSEVVGHLDLLERDGRIAREMHTNGIVYWQPVGEELGK